MARQHVLLALAISPDKIGGMESFAAELARQLQPRGWSLTLTFQRDPPATVREFLLEPGNVTLDAMPAQVGMGPGNARAFLALLRRNRPAVVLYSLGGVVRWWPLLGLVGGVRRTIYYDQTSRPASAQNYRASAKVRWIMRPLALSVCATRFIKACSDREAIVPAAKSRVIYSAVDTRRTPGSGTDFRRRYGIPEDRIVVLKVSWLVPEKGIDIALRAAQQALAVRPDLHFVFCGDGAQREQYVAQAEQLGIASQVTWTGQVQDLIGSGAFASADLQIQCSQWQEAFCLAVAEGMSAGLPVVASRIGGLPELIEHGTNGFLFEPTASAELAAHILRLASDPTLRRQMGEAGRHRAAANHDLVTNVAEWVDLLVSAGA